MSVAAGHRVSWLPLSTRPPATLSTAAYLAGAKLTSKLGDTNALPPVLRGRRSHVHLELGRACVGHGDDALAVLHLLEAERIAAQAVSRNATAKELLRTLLGRERRSSTPGTQAGVCAT